MTPLTGVLLFWSIRPLRSQRLPYRIHEFPCVVKMKLNKAHPSITKSAFCIDQAECIRVWIRFIPEKGPETDRGIDLKLTGGICFPHALFLPKALSGACNRQPFPFLRAAFHKPSARSEKETGRQKDFLLRRRFCCTIISGPVPYLRSAPEKIGRRTADLRKEFL